MKTSEAGLALTKEFEGLRTTAYRDMVGVLTIGYGHTGPDVKEGMVITEDQAEDLLKKDVERVEDWLNSHIPPECTQSQFDALVDFGFNLGTGALQQLLRHGWDQVSSQLPRWTHAGGKVVTGLVRRRAAEVELFNSPPPLATPPATQS